MKILRIGVKTVQDFNPFTVQIEELTVVVLSEQEYRLIGNQLKEKFGFKDLPKSF